MKFYRIPKRKRCMILQVQRKKTLEVSNKEKILFQYLTSSLRILVEDQRGVEILIMTSFSLKILNLFSEETRVIPKPRPILKELMSCLIYKSSFQMLLMERPSKYILKKEGSVRLVKDLDVNQVHLPLNVQPVKAEGL